MIYLFLVLFFWLAFWSSQAGRSINSLHDRLDDWQDAKPWYSEVPEALIALTIASIGLWGWGKVFEIPALWSVSLFIVFALVSYAGKQSATWAYLVHEGHKNPNTDRNSTIKPINDWIAARLGYKLGDEGYSWVWAFTKGFITTLPVACLGAIFQPIGREIASHARGRLPWDFNFWMEFFGDGFGYSVACVSFILIILSVT